MATDTDNYERTAQQRFDQIDSRLDRIERALERLVQPIDGGQVQPSAAANSKLPDALHQLRERLRNDIDPVQVIVRALLSSGWDYVDPMGQSRKSPARVEDFLCSCACETAKWSEFYDRYPRRAGMLLVILGAFGREVRRQRDGGALNTAPLDPERTRMPSNYTKET